MRLLTDTPWQWCVLPVLLATVWLLLWFGNVSGRTRMWLAGSAPLMCAATFVVGLAILSHRDGSTQVYCAGISPCTRGGGHLTHSIAAISPVGLTIVANAVLAGALSLPLLLTTAAVDLPRMVAARRAEAARAANAGTDDHRPGC